MFRNFRLIDTFSTWSRRQYFARGHLTAGTAFLGMLSVAGSGGTALAQSATYDVVIDDTVTDPILMDTSYPGGGALLLNESGSIVLSGPSQSAVGTGTEAWTFQIDGAIRSNGHGSGAIASHADDTFNVGETGVIEALDSGTAIFSSGGITIDNSGRIEGEDYGLLVTSGGISLTNHAGATIKGAVQNPGTGTNYIDNSGSIHNTGNLSSLYLNGAATIYNREGATISSDSITIDAGSSGAFLYNEGSITSTNAVGFDTSAVFFTKSGTITNTETGNLSADTGVWLGNWYEMTSPKATLSNSGSISGTKFHGALFYNLEEASLTNTETGTLEGKGNGALFYGLTRGEIANAGTIRGGNGLFVTNDATLASDCPSSEHLAQLAA